MDKNGNFIGSWNQTAEKAGVTGSLKNIWQQEPEVYPILHLHLCFSCLGSGHLWSWNTTASISQAHIFPTLTPEMTVSIKKPLEHFDGSVGSHAYFSRREEAEHSA